MIPPILKRLSKPLLPNTFMKYVDVKNQRANYSNKPKAQNGGRKILLPLMLFFLIIIAAVFFSGDIKALFNPISIVANFTGSSLKETDGRTNVLILGSDRRSVGNVTSVLTDTIIVASIGRVDNDVVLISLPRDLWVQSPAQGFYERINAMYTYGGSTDTTKVVENVLGIPIHYYAVVDFNLFQETINVLDGIEIDVETAFEDFEYPVEGKENDNCGRTAEQIEEMKEQSPVYVFPCRYEYIKFEKGPQKMEGPTALKYARSRHGTNDENTDFARAKRQQKIIVAVKNKALSLNTLLNPSKLKELYDTYAANVDTNISLTDAQGFYLLSQEVDFSNIRSIVLDDRSSAEVGGLLYHPSDSSLYGGRYVLIPRAGDFSQIHAYVQKYIFELKGN